MAVLHYVVVDRSKMHGRFRRGHEVKVLLLEEIKAMVFVSHEIDSFVILG